MEKSFAAAGLLVFAVVGGFGFDPLQACEMLDDALGLGRADKWLQLSEARFRDALEAAEVSQQPLLQLFADAGNRGQLGFEIAHRPTLAMVGDGKAMRLVAAHP